MSVLGSSPEDQQPFISLYRHALKTHRTQNPREALPNSARMACFEIILPFAVFVFTKGILTRIPLTVFLYGNETNSTKFRTWWEFPVLSQVHGSDYPVGCCRNQPGGWMLKQPSFLSAWPSSTTAKEGKEWRKTHPRETQLCK